MDEGYSEDTRSQDELDSPIGMDGGNENLLQSQIMSATGLPTAVLALSEAEKAGMSTEELFLASVTELMLTGLEFAYNILRTLRVSSIAGVVDRLWPLFHKDPVMIFPSEIMSQIFSYLTPSMLLEASRASRSWRERILDNGLWKRKFNTEGWSLDVEAIQDFETTYNGGKRVDTFSDSSRGRQRKQKGPVQDPDRSSENAYQPIQSQNTSTPYRIQARARLLSPARPFTLGGQAIDGGDLHDVTENQELPDVEMASPGSSRQDADTSSDSPLVQDFLRARDSQTQNEATSGATRPAEPSSRTATGSSPHQNAPLMWGAPGSARLNYHHIFKQKRKLEHNWDTGQYKSFQLPHRDHPEDAHTECVYTIQYSGKYLVSGSRDRTLRIWDLDTQRLVREPLEGHTGSVLCLQFDDSKEEDLIVSGSSDESVILWQFSTGRMLKKLYGAHKESVLNLKFDHRFLVTCSKDKTIKIWNRHELRIGDRDYPVKGVPSGGQCPAYILDASDVGVALREPYLFPNKTDLLEPYTHLMTLDLHGAAVNAIQIYKDELVSASGDRNIRIWNIHTGESSTKMEAHTKGIACVQYDGMRIVSGSSDKTIRIWDPISRTEVARLDGHTNLVRTIQAAFADYPGGRKALENEALEVERNFRAASMAGLLGPESGRKARGTPGSRKPKDFKSIGAKIPPSGGGGRWGRIVSGSYDETIIIWKKTEDDEWVIGHRLRQEEALRAAGPPLASRSDPQAQAHAQAAQAQATLNLANHLFNHHPANRPGPAQAQVQAGGVQGPLPAPQTVQDLNGWSNPAMAQAYQQLAQTQQFAAQQPGPNQQQVAGPPHNPFNGAQPGAPPQQRPRLPRPMVLGQANQVPAVGQPNARVFKLQFDARRIICCSQDPKIVGWDFANGDAQIIECSPFFAAPQ